VILHDVSLLNWVYLSCVTLVVDFRGLLVMMKSRIQQLDAYSSLAGLEIKPKEITPVTNSNTCDLEHTGPEVDQVHGKTQITSTKKPFDFIIRKSHHVRDNHRRFNFIHMHASAAVATCNRAPLNLIYVDWISALINSFVPCTPRIQNIEAQTHLKQFGTQFIGFV
jgi:hypothetical protein